MVTPNRQDWEGITVEPFGSPILKLKHIMSPKINEEKKDFLNLTKEFKTFKMKEDLGTPNKKKSPTFSFQETASEEPKSLSS